MVITLDSSVTTVLGASTKRDKIVDNLSMQLVKTGIANNTLVVTTEHLVRPEEDVQGVVNVSIQLVLAAVHLWHQRVLGIEPEAEGGPEGGSDPEPGTGQ